MVLRSLKHIYDVPAMMKQDFASLFTSKLITIADQSEYVFRFSKFIAWSAARVWFLFKLYLILGYHIA